MSMDPNKEGNKEANKEANSARENDFVDFEKECRSLVGQEPVMLAQDFHVIEALMAEEGVTEADVCTGIAEAMERSDPKKRFRSWSQMVGWCRTAAKSRLAQGPRAIARTRNIAPSEPIIDFGGGYSAPYQTIRSLWAKGKWLPDWGPKPGEAGCRVPPSLLAEIMGEKVA